MSITGTSSSMFQFQTGAIKSPGNLQEIQSGVRFQFQTGAIKRLRARLHHPKTIVSIPNWCD